MPPRVMIWSPPPIPNGIAKCRSGKVKPLLIAEEESGSNQVDNRFSCRSLDMATHVFQGIPGEWMPTVRSDFCLYIR